MSNPRNDAAILYADEDKINAYANAMIKRDQLSPPYDARLDRSTDGRLIADEYAGLLKPERNTFTI